VGVGGFWSGLGVGVAGDVEGHGEPVAVVVVADLDAGQVERGEHQLDLASDQRGLDLVGVAVQRHRRGLGDRALGRPQERLGQRLGRGHGRAVPEGVPALVPAGDRGLAGFGVGPVVVDAFRPGREFAIEVQQRRGRGKLLFG
jgi:hypothetical protein